MNASPPVGPDAELIRVCFRFAEVELEGWYRCVVQIDDDASSLATPPDWDCLHWITATPAMARQGACLFGLGQRRLGRRAGGARAAVDAARRPFARHGGPNAQRHYRPPDGEVWPSATWLHTGGYLARRCCRLWRSRHSGLIHPRPIRHCMA